MALVKSYILNFIITRKEFGLSVVLNNYRQKQLLLTKDTYDFALYREHLRTVNITRFIADLVNQLLQS